MNKENSLFINAIKNVLVCSGSISRVERDKAIELIKQHFVLSNLTLSGPCLHCCSAEISYVPGPVHVAQGDKFLDSMWCKWRERTRVKVESSSGTSPYRLNGYNSATVFGYLCDDCVEVMRKFIEIHEKRRTRKKESDAQRNRDILEGKVKVSAIQRFNLLYYNISQEDVRVLSQMPYKDFLTTPYWDIVRKYKMHRAGYRCELCSARDVLNVHHKTYENHGNEHNHLDDLTVLCRDCHAKFHDKLVARED